MRPFASKAPEQAARIAGVLTLWSDLDAAEVTPQAMAWGIELAQFYLSEALRLTDTAAVTPETERAEVLRMWLLEKWTSDVVTPRDVVRLGPSRLRESKQARETLAVLERHGWIVRLPEGTEVEGIARREAYRVVRSNHAV